MRGLRLRFAGKRCLALIPQLLGVSVVAFLLVRLLPGNPAAALLGPQATPEQVKALTTQMGLDKPWSTQYWIYLKGIVHGDLGWSFFTSQSVGRDLIQRVPATVELLVSGIFVALVVGVGLGTLSAARQNRGPAATLSRIYGRLAGSFPDFWIALVAVYFLFYRLRWFPAPVGRLSITTTPPPKVTGFFTIDSLLAGQFSTVRDAVSHLALPALTLGLIIAPMFARMTNAALTEVLSSDYIRYARATGVGRSVLYRYALRNSLPPVLTVMGIVVVYLLGGDVLIEKVFAWPGIGLYAVNAVTNDDYAALQGFVLLSAAFTMLVYLVVDLIHSLVDPRVAFE